MTIRSLLGPWIICGVLGLRANAATITVTTTNNVSPASGEVSLLQALGQVHGDDEIRFNIPGPGPHYIATPPNGYPLITNDFVTINGYSQPGSSPNTNSILAPNNAKIQIVLDSRNGGFKPMDFPPTAPNDSSGYTATDGAVLGVVGATEFQARGLSFLGVPAVGSESEVSLSFISFARGASGQIAGCWLGVDPDGKTVAGASRGVTGFRYQGKDSAGNVTNTLLINGLVIGVEPKATTAVQQFNVIVGMPSMPIVVEGDGTRISGNFITVLPDGLHDFDVALDDNLKGQFQGAIEIGRGGNNTLIGTDGDGVNDENERNVFGGMLPTAMGGYDHLIEFYSQNPGTNIVFAGNYVGVGIDGKTRFTNGVPVLNGAGADAQYRVGSDFDGVSDSIEGNLISNNYPLELFPAAGFAATPEALSFFSQLNTGTAVSLRGNSLINNFPFPVSPVLNGGNFLTNYYAKALLDPASGINPTLLTNSTVARLKGSVPRPDPNVYSRTIVDVYVADPVGMTNGMAAGIPQLPQGFVQGLTYLGSFIEGSALDLDATPGGFEFDISSLKVAAGTILTVTANYTGAPAGTGEGNPGDFSGITLNADGTVTITWVSGSLQSAPAVTGPWTDEVTTDNSFTTPTPEPAEFYRLQAGEPPVTGPAAPVMTTPFSNAVPVR